MRVCENHHNPGCDPELYHRPFSNEDPLDLIMCEALGTSLKRIGKSGAKRIVGYCGTAALCDCMVVEMPLGRQTELLAHPDIQLKRFAFTGTLSVERKIAERWVTMRGGRLDSAVRFGTDYLVLGDKGEGTLKHKTALSFASCNVLTEAQFRAFVSRQKSNRVPVKRNKYVKSFNDELDKALDKALKQEERELRRKLLSIDQIEIDDLGEMRILPALPPVLPKSKRVKVVVEEAPPCGDFLKPLIHRRTRKIIVR